MRVSRLASSIDLPCDWRALRRAGPMPVPGPPYTRSLPEGRWPAASIPGGRARSAGGAASSVHLGGVGLDPFLPGHQDVAWLRSHARADEPVLLELIHEPAGPREPHLQLSLQHRGGSELRADHEVGGLVEQLVLVLPFLVLVVGARPAEALDGQLVRRLLLGADPLGDRGDLLLG